MEIVERSHSMWVFHMKRWYWYWWPIQTYEGDVIELYWNGFGDLAGHGNNGFVLATIYTLRKNVLFTFRFYKIYLIVKAYTLKATHDKSTPSGISTVRSH